MYLVAVVVLRLLRGYHRSLYSLYIIDHNLYLRWVTYAAEAATSRAAPRARESRLKDR